MERKIITIDGEKCDGCGLCVTACHEGAIGLVDGKAALLRDDYCDGLGACLPVCPTGAITFATREAAAYNEEEVKKNAAKEVPPLACGCPGTNAKTLGGNRESHQPVASNGQIQSELRQWPVQIKLAPVKAAHYNGAGLLIAADCAAYAHGNFHRDFMRGKITLIGCPKLDEGDYSEKLGAIIASNDIKSVTVVRMEVPCCGGIEHAVKTALKNSGKMLPWRAVTLTTEGEVEEE